MPRSSKISVLKLFARSLLYISPDSIGEFREFSGEMLLPLSYFLSYICFTVKLEKLLGAKSNGQKD